MSLRVQNNRSERPCAVPIALQRSSNGDQAVEFYFRTEARFLLTASGSCSRAVHTSISPCARSLVVAGDRYLSLQRVIAIVCLGSVFSDGKAIKKALHPSSRTKSVTFHSRVTTCIHRYLTISALASMHKMHTLLPDYGGLRRVLLSHKMISSRSSRVFFTIG